MKTIDQNLLSYAIKKTFSASLMTSLLITTICKPSYAQSVKQTNPTVSTGTHLKSVPLINHRPVTIIERQQLLSTGITDVGDLLQRLPYFNGSPSNTRINNGGDGSVFVDLRGIGNDRTLILVDGHRTVDGGDFQTIPSVMIERVEILKEGASAIYGADAVAGVINIITRSDFTGTEIEFSTSDSFETNHVDTTRGSLIFGTGNDSSHVVIGIQHEDQSGAQQSDTPYEFLQNSFIILDPDAYRAAGFNINADYMNTIGSSRIPCGNFNLASGGPSLTIIGNDPSTGDCGTPGALLTPADFREYNGGFFDENNDSYNYAPVNYIQTPFEKSNIFFNGHKNINAIKLFTNIRYNHRKSEQLSAPVAYDTNFDPAYPLDNGNNGIPASNVFNPFGENVARARRRMTEMDRRFTQDIQQYQALIGARGRIYDTTWNWEASYNYGYRENKTKNFNQFINSRLLNALGPSFFDANGVATCGTPDNVVANCVPLNLFGGTGTVTPEMIDYISTTLTNVTKTQLSVFNLNLAGVLFDSPAGSIDAAFGAEYRELDSDFISNQPIRNVGPMLEKPMPPPNNYNVTSLYTEWNAPLLDNQSYGKLHLNIGARYDDYSTGRSNTTLQGSLNYQPSDSLVIRATYHEVFHEPSIDLLFSERFNSFPQALDPCESGSFELLTPEQQNICLAQGVPPGGLLQADAQLRLITEGNPDLSSETGVTKSLGLRWSPEYIKGLSTSLNWWHLDLKDGFNKLSLMENIFNCLNSSSADSAACQRVSRRADGSIIYVLGGPINVSTTHIEGIDFDFNYTFNHDFGQFEINLQYSKTLDHTTRDFARAPEQSLEGRFTNNATYVDDKAQFSATWHHEAWSIFYALNYIGNINADLQNFNQFDLINNGGNFNTITQSIGSQIYNDLAISYEFDFQETDLTFGINNIFDKDPVFIASAGNGGTQPATYRSFGRTWFLRWRMTF